ncbi:GNAT family N-acetyltransferase [Synechococcus sp. PCC 7336]|uniref:GNAT family N-acetyltransferase n=1 Tax=Synechococcus sp. PCC 7336 TaxID=195250 RepID=UPI0003826489|nr:GNAT family N-acetyltransferase [Synechococcus sp. PCC 7336]
MTIVTIRKALESDASEIARIHVESWKGAYKGLMPDDVLDALNVSSKTEAWKSLLTNPENHSYVAEVNSSTAGFASLCACRDPDKNSITVGEIAAIYVHPSNWRLGYGSRLIAKAFEFFRGFGNSEIILWVLEGNRMARDFYEKHGFLVDGESKTHPKSGLVEIRYATHIK